MAMPPSGYKNWGDYCREDPCFEPLKRSDGVAGVFEPVYYRCKYCDKKVPHDSLRPHLNTKTHDRKEEEYKQRRKRARLAKQSASASIIPNSTPSAMATTPAAATVPATSTSGPSGSATSLHPEVQATMAFIDSQPYDFAPEIIAAQQKDHYMMTLYTGCLEVAETLVKKHMAQYDPTHDWAHVDRVRNTALRIARTLPKVDVKVVELAALFHDVADSKYTSSATLKTTLAPFLHHDLTSKALTQAQIANILDIVPAVSWTAEKALRETTDGWTAFHDNCLELHAVQDADRLDAIGAVGIMRCAGFSAVKGRKLLDDGDGAGSAEEHFEEKLFKIKDRMKTPFGKEEAGRRHQTMVNWMSALQAEKRVCEIS